MKPKYTFRMLLVVFVAIGGCAQLPKQDKGGGDWAASRFFEEGHKALEAGDYNAAVQYFSRLQERYPSDRNAPQAQLEIAYAYYKKNELDKAVVAADRYIRWYPEYPHVDYAFYVKGLARYRAGIQSLAKAKPADNSRATTKPARQSFQYFAELTRRFPNSAYTEDALQRMMRLRNKLAAYELSVARSDLEHGDAESAASRAEYIVEHYQHSNAVPQAYALMVRAYQTLGLDELANDALFVLQKKYPDALPSLKSDVPENETLVETKAKPLQESKKLEVTETSENNAQLVTVATTPVLTDGQAPVSAQVRTSTVPENLQTVSVRIPAEKPEKSDTVAAAEVPPAPLQSVTIKAEQPRAGLNGDEWLLKQNPDYYTLQLLGVDNSQAILQFAMRHHIQDRSAYFRSSRSGKNWYSLVYGVYKSRASAKAALDDLATELRRAKPWIRQLRDIHNTIKNSADIAGQ